MFTKVNIFLCFFLDKIFNERFHRNQAQKIKDAVITLIKTEKPEIIDHQSIELTSWFRKYRKLTVLLKNMRKFDWIFIRFIRDRTCLCHV